MREESGVSVAVKDLDEAGVLLFEFVSDPQIWEVHIFRTTHYAGTITETEGNCISLSFSLSYFLSLYPFFLKDIITFSGNFHQIFTPYFLKHLENCSPHFSLQRCVPSGLIRARFRLTRCGQTTNSGTLLSLRTSISMATSSLRV